MTRAADTGILIDEAAVRAEIAALCAASGGTRRDGRATDPRAGILAVLKRVNAEGREKARLLLVEERHGMRCAERLSAMMDTIIRIVYDHAVERVFKVDNPSSSEHMTLAAVGGYGRGTLGPASDIDLLFLLPYKQTPWGESVVEYVLYMLWDLGLKVGHATRRVDECIRLARSDMTIRTALLEARRIWGDEALFAELRQRFSAEVVKGTGPEFILAKLAERDERHRRQGTSRYLVEPNVKEGKGGLRDLHTLFWIAKYFYETDDTGDLVARGVFSKAEMARFHKCEDFLWAVRCNLHYLTRRPDDRLGFEWQREIAALLGYQGHPGLSPVERFMKHYFLVAKDVGDLTRIFCAALEETHAKPIPVLDRVFGRAGRRRRKSLPDTPQFVVENERLGIADDGVFERDPVDLLRIFHVADKSGLDFHPDALKLITRSLRLVDARLRDDEEANRLFLEILTSRKHAETVLRSMNETGVLGRFIGDFGKVVAMMQFNMYHHYTVDEHTLRAIGILAAIERGEGGGEHPLATDLIRKIQHRRELYVALFLHDIAKGRPEDHSVAGARIARRLCPRFGFTPAETELTAWLVEQHLTMSIVAQSRDLADRKTIRDFAAVVQTIERLKLLLILTVADIRAVGPGVWTGWKGQLLRTLYYETEPFLLGGHSQLSRDQRVAAAKAELGASLADWPAAARERALARHYDPYWMRVDLPVKIAHAELLRKSDEAGRRLATAFTARAFEGVTEITVVAPDHPRLLSTLAGACTAAGANIVDAQIFTTTDGLALDTIMVSREFPADEDELRRAERIAKLIEAALEGRERLPEMIARRVVQQKKPPKAFVLPTEVTIDNDLSEQFTVIEVSSLDRPGLLYELTRSISDLALNIASAHVATFGERAVDVFYVTDLTRQKIQSSAKHTVIRKRILQALDETGEAKAAKKAG
ncbi:[protein-PII] uridylyltransferase [Oharaeibacter diazotrophicus]|uniref:Bifunctional uridylyltransferase/uridylyl-removing enzyme n=1 Tax=Oharaeibacter diazotrophicus TaxID=1920512 RepID=A0A4R6R8I7_9HYPH|nr:[protein-PII] uridylyltransferase [Oharaeibacter diazotrophicus]TDP82341.1 UTP--GlnB (protein PII) uridylyltransferase GlnD [Oharaeibacter diazotrophicus]BBE72896.1 bifunctional uridylyltransferase/uridylyl-removing enzyme [Pleomorphomonas sp. SM30]GLS76934.1 bifunctional uridylyltransferase/uridylyl-removing enzyme [Oharaeibacter diazotrophicus]